MSNTYQKINGINITHDSNYSSNDRNKKIDTTGRIDEKIDIAIKDFHYSYIVSQIYNDDERPSNPNENDIILVYTTGTTLIDPYYTLYKYDGTNWITFTINKHTSVLVENKKLIYVYYGDDNNNHQIWNYLVGISNGKNSEIFNDYNNEVQGDYAHAEGTNTISSGKGTHAEGVGWDGSGTRPSVIDVNNPNLSYYCGGAYGRGSHIEGSLCVSKGNFSHSEGNNNYAYGQSSHAEGQYTKALGVSSHTGGNNTVADKNFMTAIGKYNIYDSTQPTLNDDKLFVVGNGTTTNLRRDAFVVYDTGITQINDTLRMKDNNTTQTLKDVNKISKDDNNIALTHNQTLATEAFVLANPSTVGIDHYVVDSIIQTEPASPSENDIIFIYDSTTGKYTLKKYISSSWTVIDLNVGSSVFVKNINIMFILKDITQTNPQVQTWIFQPGVGKDASDSPIGFKGEVFNDYNHNIASGIDSHAEGNHSTASGNYSHVEGKNAISAGEDSHAEGLGWEASETVLTRPYITYDNYNYDCGIAYGKASHIEGAYCHAEKDQTHAEGYKTLSLGISSHAEGDFTIAKGILSHAEGNANQYWDDITDPTLKDTRISISYTPKDSEHLPDTSYPCGVASGFGSHIEGGKGHAYGSYSHAEGLLCLALNYEAHAEGYGTIAEGHQTHSEGIGFADNNYTRANIIYNSISYPCGVARGNYSHVENNQCHTSGNNSHAEGYKSLTIGKESHAEGRGNISYGEQSHAEGFGILNDETRINITYDSNGDGTDENYPCGVAVGIGSHIEGGQCNTSGNFSHAEGSKSLTLGTASHAEGYGTIAYGHYSHAEGTGYDNSDKRMIITYNDNTYYGGVAKGLFSHTEGLGCNSYGDNSHAEGKISLSLGTASHAEGYGTIAYGSYSHAEGSGYDNNSRMSITYDGQTYYGGVANGGYSHVEGRGCNSYGSYSHAGGYSCLAGGEKSHASGEGCIAMGRSSFAHGYYTQSNENYTTTFGYATVSTYPYGMSIGIFNDISKGTDGKYTKPAFFCVGNGSSSTYRSNVFRISASNNQCYAVAYNTGGADYAEYFEVYDKTIPKTNYKCKFISLIDDKVKIASSNDDYILGVYTTNPSVVGNNPDYYPKMFKRDENNEIIYEEVNILKPEFQEIQELKNKNIELNEEQKKLDEETLEKDKYKLEKQPVIDECYNNELPHKVRSERDEWIPVGLLGKLLVIDNGTCEVNKYCKVADDGTAIPYNKSTDGDIPHWRVIKRYNDTRVFIIFK